MESVNYTILLRFDGSGDCEKTRRRVRYFPDTVETDLPRVCFLVSLASRRRRTYVVVPYYFNTGVPGGGKNVQNIENIFSRITLLRRVYTMSLIDQHVMYGTIYYYLSLEYLR